MSLRSGGKFFYLKLRETGRILFSNKYLLYTNTVLTIGSSVLGDGLQQFSEITKKRQLVWDTRRSIHVGATGTFIGPFVHYWYHLLDWWLPGRTFKIIAKKLVADQFLCSPIVISSYLTVITVLQNKSLEDIRKTLKEKGAKLYCMEWVIWPPAQVVNFYFLPTRFRVAFDSIISFFFDWYFSYTLFGKQHMIEESKDIDKEPY